jgi:hypothetical protein
VVGGEEEVAAAVRDADVARGSGAISHFLHHPRPRPIVHTTGGKAETAQAACSQASESTFVATAEVPISLSRPRTSRHLHVLATVSRQTMPCSSLCHPYNRSFATLFSCSSTGKLPPSSSHSPTIHSACACHLISHDHARMHPPLHVVAFGGGHDLKQSYDLSPYKQPPKLPRLNRVIVQ